MEKKEAAEAIVDLTDLVMGGQDMPIGGGGIVEVVTHTPTIWQPSQLFLHQASSFSPLAEPTRELNLSYSPFVKGKCANSSCPYPHLELRHKCAECDCTIAIKSCFSL